ncbi:hypothetical protein NDU88_008121 [Pleurodeles waltl]|uniref:Uncharacterized protein n=1 Tax=Pleurodeles waltl TaxID=8319 RepID=A0AAV7VSR0_PLEWA|nr:hypothetical protein NDU88_008121 [Pleurodeles waltl]
MSRPTTGKQVVQRLSQRVYNKLVMTHRKGKRIPQREVAALPMDAREPTAESLVAPNVLNASHMLILSLFWATGKEAAPIPNANEALDRKMLDESLSGRLTGSSWVIQIISKIKSLPKTMIELRN